MKTTTADRLKEIMQQHDLRQVDILKRTEPYCKKFDVRLGRNDLSQYVSGKVLPGQEKLTVLAMALGVSEAWLMGYDVPMNSKITADEAWDAEADKFNDKMSQFQIKEKAFLLQLKVLGWSCHHIDDRQDEENDESYYLLKKDETSFRISWEDYKKFINDSETFFTKRLRDLWKQSQFYLFSGLKAAHNDNAADPEQQKLMEDDLQDMEENW